MEDTHVTTSEDDWPAAWRQHLAAVGIAPVEPYDHGLHSAGQWRSILQPEVAANMRDQLQHGPRHTTYVFEAAGPEGGRVVPTITPPPRAVRPWSSVQVRA